LFSSQDICTFSTSRS